MRVVVTTLIFLMQGGVLAVDLQWVRVAQSSFVLESGKTFVPWGFNYDHDANGRLIEDYWDEQWASVPIADRILLDTEAFRLLKVFAGQIPQSFEPLNPAVNLFGGGPPVYVDTTMKKGRWKAYPRPTEYHPEGSHSLSCPAWRRGGSPLPGRSGSWA